MLTNRSIRNVKLFKKAWKPRNLFTNRTEHKQQGSNLPGIIVFGSICITAAGLGYWQLQRYEWKVNYLEEMKQRMHESPVVLRSITELEQVLPGRRILLEGKFLHEREVLLGPRSAPTGVFPAAQGMASNPQGYYIITPFQLKNSENVIFVNRGWVRKGLKDWKRPEEDVFITAALSSVEKGSWFSPKNDAKSKQLLWLEDKSLIEATNSTDFNHPVVIADMIGLDGSLLINSFPIPKAQSSVADVYVQPITHLTYSCTWFSLSLAGFYMTYLRFRKK